MTLVIRAPDFVHKGTRGGLEERGSISKIIILMA